MSELALTAAATALLGLLTVGLVYSAIRRRQTGADYLLFWRLSPGAHAITRHMFFRGPAAEISRILLLAAATLMFAAQLFGIQ